jgi:hypothetical protein
MLNPGTFGRNIYFAHIDQSHFYDKGCEELIREATGSTGTIIHPRQCRNCIMFHEEEKCKFYLCRETFQLFKDETTHDQHHHRKCGEDKMIQATKDGKRNQWHITWALMNGRLITQLCYKQNMVKYVSLPQNNVDFTKGMRRVIEEQKSTIKSFNIANNNETQIQLLQLRQMKPQSLKDQQKTEAELAKLQFLTAQLPQNTLQGMPHNQTKIHVDATTGREYTFNHRGNAIWLDETSAPAMPQSRYKSFQFISDTPDGQSPQQGQPQNPMGRPPQNATLAVYDPRENSRPMKKRPYRARPRRDSRNALRNCRAKAKRDRQRQERQVSESFSPSSAIEESPTALKVCKHKHHNMSTKHGPHKEYNMNPTKKNACHE